MWPAANALKQQIPLLDYLQSQDWKPARRISHGRLMGLCPLHLDHQPSFLADPSKNLFYGYGCRRGGDVIRFVELSPHAIYGGHGAVAPFQRTGIFAERCDELLSVAATSSL